MSRPRHAVHREVRGTSRRFRVRIWLASAMWVPVLAVNVLAIVLALALPIADDHLADDYRLPLAADAAREIFGALAGGMITFTGIVFSAVFVAAQIQTSAYSPRLAARLRRDPVVIASLGLPTATAIYSLFALAAIGHQTHQRGHDFVPTITVLVGLVLALITIGVFVALVQRAFDSTQIGGILHSLLRRGYQVAGDVHPHVDTAPGAAPAPDLDGPATAVDYTGPPAVLSAIDRAALLRVAEESGGFVDVVPLVGQYLMPGHTVMRVHGGHGAADPAWVRQVFVLARQRTIDQDPAFVLRMLVDIAIRALSPAINDPTTTVQTIDRIEVLLVELLGRHPGPTILVDDGDVPRARVPAPAWRDYFELGVVEIRRYGSRSIQIARRLRALHERLLALTQDDDRHRVELELRLLDEDLDRAFPDAAEREVARVPDRFGLGGAH